MLVGEVCASVGLCARSHTCVGVFGVLHVSTQADDLSCALIGGFSCLHGCQIASLSSFLQVCPIKSIKLKVWFCREPGREPQCETDRQSERLEYLMVWNAADVVHFNGSLSLFSPVGSNLWAIDGADRVEGGGQRMQPEALALLRSAGAPYRPDGRQLCITIITLWHRENKQVGCEIKNIEAEFFWH